MRAFISKFFILSIIFLSFACKQEAKQEDRSNDLWALEQSIREKGKDLDVKPFNVGIERALSVRLPWAYSPLSIALKVAGQQMVSPNVNIVAKSLSGKDLVTDVSVIVEKIDLQGNAIQNEYYWIRLKLGGTVWQVAEVKQAWQCREGRGNISMNAEKCK